MRKILIVASVILTLCACSKEEPTPENVTFNLTYNIDKGVSMTRSGADLYNSFYENFVKTKKVGYPNYELTFYKGEEVVGTFKGEWDATMLTLPEGEYKVVGTSKSPEDKVASGVKFQYSTMSLNFEETVVISKGQTSLTLNPTYDCYLVFFDKTVIDVAYVWDPTDSNSSGKTYWHFPDADTIKYAFINSASKAIEISYKTVDRADEGVLNIDLMGFEIGKYYCLDAIATGYQLPPMESGF